IVARAVCAKGKKRFVNDHVLKPDYRPEKILGFWVGNHQYSAKTFEDKVIITGKYEVTTWYTYDEHSKTDLTKKTFSFTEQIALKEAEGRMAREEEVLVTELMEPTCLSARIEAENLVITVAKSFSVEIIGDTKMTIVAYPASILEAEEEEFDDYALPEAEDGAEAGSDVGGGSEDETASSEGDAAEEFASDGEDTAGEDAPDGEDDVAEEGVLDAEDAQAAGTVFDQGSGLSGEREVLEYLRQQFAGDE
ncbi:MAG TPA: outer spore coat protein CotE, partial [Bacillota bacterium]|nr:outer spore coat protein CotE [Bacillota bacterium]